MIISLFIILALIMVLPFTVKKVEHNLEYFLFIMGLAAIVVSGVMSKEFILHTLSNYLVYTITIAVIITGFLFIFFVDKLRKFINWIIGIIPLKIFVFLLIIIIGLASSVITAIVASLLLVEIIAALPINRDRKVKLTIISCFSIGLGAVLTPIGEPLATIVVSKLNADFFYLFRNLGIDIIPAIIILGLLGAYFSGEKEAVKNADEVTLEKPIDVPEEDEPWVEDKNEGPKDVLARGGKIFIFVIALEFLGAGFKPLIDTYIVNLDSRLLYFINMLSAVLDNATLAAAEISPSMSDIQIKSLLLGLLISGGMLIPGNIPNIISAGKLNIKSKEWAKLGLPLGAGLMILYFVILFVL